jgi:hypothetical protein
VLLVGCTGAYQSQEEWFVSGADAEFPADRFVVGVGYGDTMKDADDMAIGEVGKLFNTRVVTVTLVDEKYRQENAGDATAQHWDFESRTFSRVRGEADLEGVEVVRRTVVEGQHYSMAVLDKTRAASKLREKYAFLNLKIEEALSAPASDAAARIRGIARALYLMETRARMASRLQVLGYKATLEPEKYRELVAELGALLRGRSPIVIRCQSPELAALLREAFADKGLVVLDSAESGVVVDAAVEVSSARKGDMVEYVYTVALSAFGFGQSLAQKNLSDRLSHTDATLGLAKVMYEVRDDAVRPFAAALEKALLGDYDKEEKME